MWPKGPEAVVFAKEFPRELGKNNGFAQENQKGRLFRGSLGE